MQIAVRSNFTTVKTEGPLLPADMLQRISAGDLKGLRPEEYHLASTERLNEAINRSWVRLLGVWQAFNQHRQNQSSDQKATSLTRDKWLHILFQELGYGRVTYVGKLPPNPADLEQTYPISHVWERTPLLWLGFQQELDRRDPTFKRSPHSLLQEFLNRTDYYLWGMVTNGLTLRLLRDNASLTRLAYVEFDLEGMFTGELYADFSLFWLVCHQSRVELLQPEGTVEKNEDGEEIITPGRAATPADCWLEKWSGEAKEQGTRALDGLRDGVKAAITALGQGFLKHPANQPLRQKLQSGTLSTQDYYRQLLRLAYRLIFLLVAEERQLLLLPNTPAEVQAHYYRHYALSRLKKLAEKQKGGPHPDLYRSVRLVMEKLREGYEPLGLPGLGGFLFSGRATPDLDQADMTNYDWLEAFRALAFVTSGNSLRYVDYLHLGTEELGSVYESLLELHPDLNVPAGSFELRHAAGSERKTTGSYYTPASLIIELLNSALEPVIAERLKGVGSGEIGSREEALLSIKVVDPACGSGHFLIAAANRLALHLARIRTGDEEPAPAEQRHALREVVGKCIYGVDINEMSVELCKVALWMETLDPGRPLTFLDKNIQVGNSLLGTTPALLEKGIPDEAFNPLTGDDKTYCAEWKKRNKKEVQEGLWGADMQPWSHLDNITTLFTQLNETDDTTLAGVKQQEEQYTQAVQSADYRYGKLLADAWCAAFVWRKMDENRGGFAYPITQNVLRRLRKSPFDRAIWMENEIIRLAKQYQFFHWHLAFPQVFRGGVGSGEVGSKGKRGGESEGENSLANGFDVVLGNPPWDMIQTSPQEFFAVRDPEVAKSLNMSARTKKITQLAKDNPALYAEYQAEVRKTDGVKHFIHSSGKYPFTSFGRLNMAPLFAELARHLVNQVGRIGIIVPTGIATDSFNQYFFADLIKTNSLVSLFDFENRQKLFAIDSRSKFCLLTLCNINKNNKAVQLMFFVHQTADLKDEQRRFSLTAQEISLLNPNTLTCPIFRSKRDAELTKNIYRQVPVLIKEASPEENLWQIKFMLMFMMNTDSSLFKTREQLEMNDWWLYGNYFVKNEETFLPLYEGRMIGHFNHRMASVEINSQNTFRNASSIETTVDQYLNPKFFPLPRYWVRNYSVINTVQELTNKKWLIGYMNITSATNTRTCITSVIPISGIGNSITGVSLKQSSSLQTCFFANLTSFVFDYICKQKISGNNFNQFIVKQLPVLPPETYNQPCPFPITPHSPLPTPSLAQWLLPRVVELTYTAYDLQPFAQDCGYFGPPFRWDEERRFLLRCELDAAYFHLYGIAREDVEYIMDTFPIVRRKDEKAHGEYRTKRVILEIYDKMQGGGSSEVGSEGQREGVESREIGSGGKLSTSFTGLIPADPAAAHPWDSDYLGEELPIEQWWREVEPEVKASPTEAEPLVLVAPPVAKPTPKNIPAGSVQMALVFTPNTQPRPVRLKRAMELGTPQKEGDWVELVSFLGDEDSNIRWLASSALVRHGGRPAVQVLEAFMAQASEAQVVVARPEVVRVLQLLAETHAEDEVRGLAQGVLARL